MDSELLKTFLEVSRTRHFGRAAEALYLTQSAVSFRIRQLENQLGVALFTRHRNNIRLTSAGERLLPYASSLISTWLMAKKEVFHSQQHKLSIGASAGLWEVWLTNWLQTLYQNNSNLYLETIIAQRHSMVQQLHERQLDLLITTEVPKMDELVSQKAGEITLQLFCSGSTTGHEKYEYIKIEWGADFTQHESFLLQNEQPPVLTTASAQLARQLLDTRNACAFLPQLWGESDTDLTAITEVPVVNRSLYFVWLQNGDNQEEIRQLLEHPIMT